MAIIKSGCCDKLLVGRNNWQFTLLGKIQAIKYQVGGGGGGGYDDAL